MHEDVQVQPAATVVLLRDTAGGLETLLIQRGEKLVFHGGAWAFPGGRVDDEDRAGVTDDDDLAAARAAAVRETREETGLVVSAEELVPCSHWTTPPGFPRRFATWFFLVEAAGHDVVVDGDETQAHRWIAPEAAAEARARGDIELPPPTFVTLASLRRSADVQSALSRARALGVLQYEPKRQRVEGGSVSLYEGDVAYPDGDPEQPGPRRRFYMLESDWRYEDDA
jgi:8-oxo-dGTP pyrophosphatase MutT (NUDIX family)